MHRQAGSGQDADRPGYDLLQQMRGDSHGLDRHQPWNDLSQRLELEQAVTEVHLDSLLRQARQRTGPQAWGNLPGEIQDALSKLSAAPAEISWKAVLRLFMGYSGKTKIRNTIKRASKRYGTTPGNKVRRMHRLLVAVDTSGSIAQADLDTFFREIYFLWRAGALFEVVECDTKIGGRYAYKGQPPRSVYGRGEPILMPPCNWPMRSAPTVSSILPTVTGTRLLSPAGCLFCGYSPEMALVSTRTRPENCRDGK